MPQLSEAPAFYCQVGINVETYDVRTQQTVEGSTAEGDLDFYAALAVETGGPILELGSGTGRVAWHLAEHGFEVLGLEKSDAMLMAAEAKRWKEEQDAEALARFEEGDMAGFSLGRRFPLILIPYRGFQALLEPEEQRRCLRSCREHLEPGGLLVLHLFDPRLELLVEGSEREEELPILRDPISGNITEASIVERSIDRQRQVLTEVWKFTEVDGSHVPIRQEHETLQLRWTGRQELRWLLELEDLEVMAEYGDFEGDEPSYGSEQIWVVRARGEEA